MGAVYIAMSIPTTMRALQQTSLKGPQDMRLITDAPVPRPGQGEVLIRVAAAGVNFADLSRAYGTFLGGPQPPYLAGFEAAGEVVAAGEAGRPATGDARDRRRGRGVRRVHGPARGRGDAGAGRLEPPSRRWAWS